MSLKLKERYGDWALVTGGHSGIGFCLSEQIASEGVNVVIAARSQKALDERSTFFLAYIGLVEGRGIIASRGHVSTIRQMNTGRSNTVLKALRTVAGPQV